MGTVSEKRYCAFCKIPRKVYTKKHISWANVLLALFTSVAVMFVVWFEFNAKMFILFALFLAGAEVFVQIRWRMSVNCPFCGFDPVMYMKDRERLVKKVKTQLEKARQKPGLMLSKYNPLKELPQRKLKEQRSNEGKELHSETPS